jgi:hypothetical protein
MSFTWWGLDESSYVACLWGRRSLILLDGVLEGGFQEDILEVSVITPRLDKVSTTYRRDAVTREDTTSASLA